MIEQEKTVWTTTDNTEWDNRLLASQHQEYLDFRKQNHSFNRICRDIELDLSDLALDEKQKAKFVCRILRTIKRKQFQTDFDRVDQTIWDHL